MIYRDIRSFMHDLPSRMDRIAVDYETTGLNPRTSRIAVVTICVPDTSGDKIGVFHVKDYSRTEIFTCLRELLLKVDTVIYHNGASYDVPVQMGEGLPMPRTLADTLVRESVLDTGARRKRFSLIETLSRYGITISKQLDSHEYWSNDVLTDEQVRYCVEDAKYLPFLWEKQQDKIEANKLVEACCLEERVSKAVAWMVYNGIPIDLRRLFIYIQDNMKDAADLEKQIRKYVGNINMASPAQWQKAFRNLGLNFSSTARKYLTTAMLDGLENFAVLNSDGAMPDIGEMLDFLHLKDQYSLAQKIVDTYSADWISEHVVSHDDGVKRVHPSLMQITTETGRMACREPNLQATARRSRSEATAFFGGVPGYKVCAVDYAQIEMVIAGYISRDKALLDAIKQGTDVHKLLAVAIYGGNLDTVTKDQRQKAKSANFSLIYGGSAKGLRNYAQGVMGLKMSLQEAENIHQKYFQLFTGFRAWHASARRIAYNSNAYPVTMVNGLRRILVAENLTPQRILNTTVQGNASVGLKYGLAEAVESGLGPHLCLSVHDEVVGFARDEDISEVAEAISYYMIRGMKKVIPTASTGITISDYWVKD